MSRLAALLMAMLSLAPLSARAEALDAQGLGAMGQGLSLNASIESQHIYRGVDYSLGRPAFALNLNYDQPGAASGGAYAGLGLVSTRRTGTEHAARSFSLNAGMARPISGDVSLDAGVSHNEYVLYTDEKYTASDTEAYVGAIWGDVSAYVHYSPRYLGTGPKAVYLDLTGTLRPVRRLRLTGHAGFLSPMGKWPHETNPRNRSDLRATATWEMERAELRLSWSTSSHYAYEPPGQLHQSDSVTAGLSYYF